MLHGHKSNYFGTEMDSRTELEQKVINKSNSRVLHESKIPAVGNGRGINEFYRELFI